MILNFDNKNLLKVPKGPRVFQLPPSSDFAIDFVKGLLSRFEKDVLKTYPELLSRVRILTSNKRSARRIKEVLQDFGVIILPKITQVDDLEEFFSETIIGENFNHEFELKAPLISKLERFLILEGIIREIKQVEYTSIVKNSSFDLADSLGNLIDEINTSNVNLDDLEKIISEDLSQHWQLSLDLMKKVILGYSEILSKSGYADKNIKYIRQVDALSSHWELEQYKQPLLIVGSTGSQYATANLMRAVSKLPQGFVILPGLDKHLTKRAWEVLTPDHPQYGFLSLAQSWGLSGQTHNEIIDAPVWFEAPTSDKKLAIRAQLFSLLMRPAPVTDEWIDEGRSILNTLDIALTDVSLIEAENSRIEAASISVAIVEALNAGLNVAVITPSKLIARRVTAELRRWKISPNNSLGGYLAVTGLGVFLRQTLVLISSKFEFKSLIAVLKNTHCGGDYKYHLSNILKLEQAPCSRGNFFEDVQCYSWALSQGEEFFNWYTWLQGLFMEVTGAPDSFKLKECVDYHKNFSEKLMIGYYNKKNAGMNKKIIEFLWKTDVGRQISECFDEISSSSKNSRYFTFFEYSKLLEKVLFDREVNYFDENISSSVFIWGTLESRTQNADVVILAGLNEGVWPIYSADEPWLNRPMRALVGLDLFERKIGLSAHDFQQAAMASKLIMTRSLREKNVPAVASRWLLRFENLLIGLGDSGTKCLNEVKMRGSRLSNASKEYNSSKILIEELSDTVKTLTSRPAPIPPVAGRPIKLSVTEIDTLIRNPYAIYVKRILKLRKRENIQHTEDPRNRGNIFHMALERFINQTFKALPEIDKSCKILREAFEELVFDKNLSIEIAQLWRAQFDRRIENIVLSEKLRRGKADPFSLEVYGQYQIVLSNNEIFTITAKADRIDKCPNGYILYDYKTGKVSKNELENFSSQLDIEALMLESGSFKDVPKREVCEVALIGLGPEPKQYSKTLSAEDKKIRYDALVNLVEKMRVELTPFVARLNPKKGINFSDDYDHLSRYGEWLDDDYFEEVEIDPPSQVKKT